MRVDFRLFSTTAIVAGAALLGAAATTALLRPTAHKALRPDEDRSDRTETPSGRAIEAPRRRLRDSLALVLMLSLMALLLDACGHVALEVAMKAFGVEAALTRALAWMCTTHVTAAFLAIVVIASVMAGVFFGAVLSWLHDQALATRNG